MATAALIPLEVYELARRPNVTRVTVLVVNLMIVIYLVVRVRWERHAREAITATAS